MTYNHLNKIERDTIQYLLEKDFTFSEIGEAIKKDRTTVSKEIRRNRYLKSFTNNNAYDENAIQDAIINCELLSKSPYVCNVCKDKHKCRKNKLYYHSNIADQRYNVVKKTSREGIDIEPETIEEIEQSIIPLIKQKKQSVNQVYINHNDILYFSKTTFYKYVHLGVLSLTDTDLPKKVVYKERKKNKVNDNKRKIAILKGRKYEDYLLFKKSHPNMNTCQMDTVMGLQENKKCFLTIIDVETHFMFIRLLDKKDVKSVNAAWDSIKNNLTKNTFASLFKIVLTDNGTEFFDPMHIEVDYSTGKKVSHIFYCKPYSSWQKGCIEKNHEFIRKVLLKGTSFDDLTEEQVKRLEDIINNIPRDSLNGETPFNLLKKKHPSVIEKLNCSYIKPDDVTLNKNDILKGGK